jgi:hypothetical protein
VPERSACWFVNDERNAFCGKAFYERRAQERFSAGARKSLAD